MSARNVGRLGSDSGDPPWGGGGGNLPALAYPYRKRRRWA